MGNIGAGRMIIIDSKCEYNLEARQGASGAQTRLMEANWYPNWDEFFKNEQDGIRIAFCARKKPETDPVSFSERAKEILPEIQYQRPLYLIFGPEDHGLSNEDCSLVHHIHQLPIQGDFESLNLSHAVLLALFIIDQTNCAGDGKTLLLKDNPSEQDTAFFPKESIVAWLDALNMEIGNRRTDAYKVLKRYLLRQRPTAKELRILEAVIHQTIRKLKVR
jgi:tRNA/rRNA methyltransferase